MRFDPKTGGAALQAGRFLVLYVPPDLEPGEAAQAHALDLPADEAWTRSEFRNFARLVTAALQQAHEAVMAHRANAAHTVWSLLEKVVELGGQVSVGPNLQGFVVLTVDFFPESLDTEEWWGVELLSYNVAIEGPTVQAGLWGVAESIIQNVVRGIDLRREWLARGSR